MTNKKYVRIAWDQIKNSKVFVIDAERVNIDSYYIMVIYEMTNDSLLDQYYIWTNTPNDYGVDVLSKRGGDAICRSLTSYLTDNVSSRILNINNRRRSNMQDLSALLEDNGDEPKSLSIEYYNLGKIFNEKKAISYIGDYDKHYHIELIELVIDEDTEEYKYSNYIYGVNVLRDGSQYNNYIRKPRIHSVNGERLYASHLYDYISKTNLIMKTYLSSKNQDV